MASQPPGVELRYPSVKEIERVLMMRLLHAPPDLSVSVRFTNPGQVDVFSPSGFL